jgi:histidine triad (HIT) family protein
VTGERAEAAEAGVSHGSETCVFCRIVEGSVPSRKVYEDEYAYAFLDWAAVAPGHTLVIPRQHVADIWGISKVGAGRLMEAVHEVARLLGERLHPDGMTISQANRHAGGQDVFHIHVHLIPRYIGDGLIRRWEASSPSEPELDAVLDRLQ